jgi:zinc and cadmium transporter
MHPLDIHWIYSLGSAAFIAAFSFVGMVGLAWKPERLRKVIPWLISLAAGALLGTALGHLLPESIEHFGSGRKLSGLLIASFCTFFLLEKIIHVRSHRNGGSGVHLHDHSLHAETTPAETTRTPMFGKPNSSLTTNVLVGGAVHSFVDGMAIATAYMARTNLGVIATVAVFLHEGPHHIGDVGLLIHSHVPVRRAVLLNLIASSTSLLGAFLVLFIGSRADSFTFALLPFTTANFLYIAGSTLIPEMQQEKGLAQSIPQVALFLGGTLLMYVIGGTFG